MTQVISAANDNKVVVINLLVSAMAADRQIDLDVLNIKVEELHDEIRKLVTEKIFPKDFLRNYARLRENGETLLKQDGSIMCSIGAVMSRSEAVIKIRELNKIKEEWAQQLAKDEPGYQAMCDKHLLEMSQKAIAKGADSAQVMLLAEHLRKRQPTWEEVAARFKFEFVVTPVTMEDGEFDADLYEAQRDSVVALREGVLGAVIQHVCKESMEILETLDKKTTGSQSGEVKVNPRTVRRAQAMCVKLTSLAFIHPLIHADSGPDAYTRMLALVDPRYERLVPQTLRGIFWQHMLRFSDGQRAPLPIYESIEVTGAVRQILQGGPEKLPMLANEMKRQGRRNMAETAMAWVTANKVSREEVREFTDRRGRINEL